MILVTGAALVQRASFDDALRLSLEHVHRSRSEPGCISHAVHVDCEHEYRLVFVEQWADKDALTQHFQKPESRAFVRALSGLLAEPSTIEIYQATPLQMP
jgi:quinol monooxygenase YgiN